MAVLPPTGARRFEELIRRQVRDVRADRLCEGEVELVDRGVNGVVFDRGEYLDPRLLEPAGQAARPGVQVQSDDGNCSVLGARGPARAEVVAPLAYDAPPAPGQAGDADGSTVGECVDVKAEPLRRRHERLERGV